MLQRAAKDNQNAATHNKIARVRVMREFSLAKLRNTW
jgi:hypothetical protein